MSADDCRCYAESHCCLTLQMAEMQLQQPRDKLFSSFMTLASDSGYDLLSFRDSTVETDGTTRTSIVVEKCSNSVEPSALYALRQRSCPTSANAAPRPRRFQPKLAPQLREYPLHARATLSAASPQPPKDQLQQKQQAPPQEAKRQPQTPPQMPKPQQPTPVKMEVPSVREPLLQVDQNQPPPSLKKMPEDEDSMPASVVEVKKEASPKAPTAAPTGGKKQLSLFGAQPPTATTTATPTVAATKRQRAKAATTGEAVEAPKRKAPKVDSRSLTKLAKASAKKGTDSRPPPSMNVLDDDDEELAHRPSHSSQSSAEEVDAEEVSEPLFSVFDDAPLLDVAVTSVNDEIVMLDDAPPMAFLAATQKTSPSPPSAGEAAAVPADSNHSQRRLNAFFSTDVVAFQKTFQRELVTETKMEDGEYICVDVVRFRSKATNELITEAEYHRRTAEVLRQEQEKLAAIPATSAAAPPSDASPSPAAPSRPPVAKQAKKVQEKEKDKAPTEVRRNLMSFFKQCSN